MRIAGTSRQFVNSQSFRGEMARKRAASAGRRSKGSERESTERPSGGVWLVFSIGMPPGATAPSGQPKHGDAVTSDGVRSCDARKPSVVRSRDGETRPTIGAYGASLARRSLSALSTTSKETPMSAAMAPHSEA